MKFEERMSSLKRKHEKIDSNLHGENSRPQPDELKILELKRKKLALKDQMNELLLTQ